ncbi:FAD-binding oxidoreductase [Gemmatimonas aurantiaca]|nr:FAD-binding oxidoreductase [Gemmatimonas aurantiaca]
MITFVSLSGQSLSIDETAIESLRSVVGGKFISPQDANYHETRAIWNGMIDKKPGLIVQCVSSVDIQACVRFAGQHKILTSIRGAGHNIAGSAVTNGGLMIDLSLMKEVKVDVANKLANVQPGATLGDVDAATQKHALAVSTGINSTTGIAGLTLGGGFGWNSRKHGMTCDNLKSVEIVTADGNILHADEQENSDLFWAVRGGGGNFGVVVNFEFNLFELGPQVLSGLLIFSQSEAESILKKYREYAPTLSPETSIWVVLRQAPPLPFLAEEHHGKDVVVLALCSSADEEKSLKEIEPVRNFGTLLGEHVGMQPFVDWQQAFDPLLTPGARNYWKSHNFASLSDGAIEQAVKYSGSLPSGECEIFIAQLGEVASEPAPDAMAWSHRDAAYVLNVHSRWQDEADDDKCRTWARDFYEATKPFATGGVYVNFMTEDETDRVSAAYGQGYEKLQSIKKKYDPENLFRANHNIKPV